MWAFCSAGFAALATALSAYEVAFGFERYSRQYTETRAALELADASRPPASDPEAVVDYVTRVEGLLRSDVESWSEHYATEVADRATESDHDTAVP